MNPRYLTDLLHFQLVNAICIQFVLPDFMEVLSFYSIIVLRRGFLIGSHAAGRFFDLTYFFQTYTRFSLLSIKPAFWLVAKTQNYLLVCYCPPQTAQQPKSEQNIADYKTYTLKSKPFGAKNVTEIKQKNPGNRELKTIEILIKKYYETNTTYINTTKTCSGKMKMIPAI